MYKPPKTLQKQSRGSIVKICNFGYTKSASPNINVYIQPSIILNGHLRHKIRYDLIRTLFLEKKKEKKQVILTAFDETK